MRALGILASLGGLAVAGCLGIDEPARDNFFRPPAPVPSPLPPNTTPAGTEVASRVDYVGRQVLACNSQIGAKPLFRTIGSPNPEIFHRGTGDLYITEGLVRQCATDGVLAAVLCSELGKMVAEREAVAPTAARRPERPPPMDVRVGNDSSFGSSPDLVRQAELGAYENDRKYRNAGPPAPPDPPALARLYLLRSGYKDSDMQSAIPLLMGASKQSGLEKQITAAPAAPTMR